MNKKTASSLVMANLAAVGLIIILSQNWIKDISKFVEAKLSKKKGKGAASSNGSKPTDLSEPNPSNQYSPIPTR